MKYHILIWRARSSSYYIENGACVFYKYGCRCLALNNIREWKKALRNHCKGNTGLCHGYTSESAKRETGKGCSDCWNGKFDLRDEDPKAFETIAKISVDSEESTISEVKSYLLAAEL